VAFFSLIRKPQRTVVARISFEKSKPSDEAWTRCLTFAPYRWGGAERKKRKGGEREGKEGRGGAGGRAKRVGRREGTEDGRRGRREEGKGCFGSENLYFSPARRRRAENFGPPGGGSAPPEI
jgi:hypothetical protein